MEEYSASFSDCAELNNTVIAMIDRFLIKTSELLFFMGSSFQASVYNVIVLNYYCHHFNSLLPKTIREGKHASKK